MNFKYYVETQFPSDIKTMKFDMPNLTIQEDPQGYRMDKQTIFFGGKNWSSIKEDLSKIDKANIENFCISLFIIVSIDLNMFTYFKDKYALFRSNTMYPKFGWCGYGPHYENPKKLLILPERNKIITFNKDPLVIGEYTDLFISKCNDYFSNIIPEMSTKTFIQKILDDPQMKLHHCERDTFLHSFLSNLNSKLTNDYI